MIAPPHLRAHPDTIRARIRNAVALGLMADPKPARPQRRKNADGKRLANIPDLDPLLTLNEDLREILRSRSLGLTCDELAVRMGLPVRLIYSHLSVLRRIKRRTSNHQEQTSSVRSDR